MHQSDNKAKICARHIAEGCAHFTDVALLLKTARRCGIFIQGRLRKSKTARWTDKLRRSPAGQRILNFTRPNLCFRFWVGWISWYGQFHRPGLHSYHTHWDSSQPAKINPDFRLGLHGLNAPSQSIIFIINNIFIAIIYFISREMLTF